MNLSTQLWTSLNKFAKNLKSLINLASNLKTQLSGKQHTKVNNDSLTLDLTLMEVEHLSGKQHNNVNYDPINLGSEKINWKNNIIKVYNDVSIKLKATEAKYF